MGLAIGLGLGLTFGGAAYKSAGLAALKGALTANSVSFSVLVVGDSTANETTEWPYLFAAAVAPQFPAYTFKYSLWNNTTFVYDAASTIQAGSGPNTVTFYNLSVSGSAPDQFLADKFNVAVAAIPNVKVVFWGHGHNIATLASAVMRGRYLSGVEQVSSAHPYASIGLITQNPWLSSSTYDAAAAMIKSVAAQKSISAIDVHKVFVDAGKPSGWYSDDVHPNSTGQAQWAGVLNTEFAASPSQESALVRWLDAGTNLLVNGDFSAFSGAVPDSWTQSGSGVVSKDAIIADGSSPYSVKIVNGSSATSIFQSLSLTNRAAVIGGKVTLAARVRIASGGGSTSGSVRVFVNGTGALLNAVDVGTYQGAYKWIIVAGADVPSDASDVAAFIYADRAGGASATVNVDRVIMVAGDIPRDMVPSPPANLFAQPTDISNAAWNKTNITATAGAAMTPDGTMSGWSIAATATAGTILYQNFTAATTFSSAACWAKKGSSATVGARYILRNVTAATDLLDVSINYDTLAITYNVGSSGCTITPAGDGWFIVRLAVSSSVTAGDSMRFYAGYPGSSVTSGAYSYFWKGYAA